MTFEGFQSRRRVARPASKWLSAAALVVGGLVLAPSRAWAEPDLLKPDAEQQEAVKALMRTGIAEYRKNNLEAAREAFEKAFRISPHPEIAASLADVEMKLGRYRDALARWEYYVKEVSTDRAEAEAQIAECRRKLGSFRVTVDTPGAMIFLDGNAIGPAPIDVDIWVEPGDHKLHAQLSGRTSPEKQLSIAAGETHTVALTLDEPAPMPVSQAPPMREAPGSAPQQDQDGIPARTVVLIAGAVLTVGAIGVGVGYTLKADSAEDDARELQDLAKKDADPESIANNSYCAAADRHPACAELSKKLKEGATARDLATGSFIAAGILAVGTAVTYLLWPSKSPSAAPRTAIRVTPRIGSSHRGLSAELSF